MSNTELAQSRVENARTTQTVTVLCKIALPWIDLQCCEMREVQENTQTGPRAIQQGFRVGDVVRIRGTAYPRGEAPEGYPEKPEIMFGYAVTRGVSRKFWEEWKEQHKKAPYILNNMIIAFGTDMDCQAAAKENTGRVSGLEPIQRNKTGITDTRMPKSSNPAIEELQPDAARMTSRRTG
jgi:hypothetical protein